MFKKDNVWLGVALGIIIPAILFALIYFPIKAQGKYISAHFFENTSLFLIAANAVVMNWGLFQRNRDKTGKGMFIITGIYALIYVFYFVILE